MNAASVGNRSDVGHETPPDGGAIADRYTLGRVIGAGATATVYAGRDLVADRPVAVKVYRLGGEMHPRIQQIRELAALTMLRHPGLVTLYDGGTERGRDGRTYLVTDLVRGPTLAERLREGPLDVPLVRDLAAGLAAALAHVHAHGFVHRDVKPANILLESGREPRLADFGIAKALDGTVATATGSVAGTAAYLAPEQVRGEAVGPAADVYALGLVLLEALTGRREYPGTMVESATARLYRRPAVPTGLPWNLTALLESMTEPDPAGRPTAEAVAAAAPNPAPAGRATRARHAIRRPARGNVSTLVAAALLLMCLIGSASLVFASAGSVESSPSAPASPTSSLATPSATPLSPVPVAQRPAIEVAQGKGKGKGKGNDDEKGGEPNSGLSSGRGNGSEKHDT